MKTNLFKICVFILIVILCLYLLIYNGSSNTPYNSQKANSDIPVVDDPSTSSQFFDFDFDFPEIEIPIASNLFSLGSNSLLLILMILLIMIILVLSSILVSRRQRQKKEIKGETISIFDQKLKEMDKRRVTLGKRIEEIISFLNSCLDGKFNEGITEGYEKLDRAMKEYSKISRPGWLTPREYTRMEIPYFNHEALINAVELFYRITYGQKLAKKEVLENFITNLKLMITDQSILKWKADKIDNEEVNS